MLKDKKKKVTIKKFISSGGILVRDMKIFDKDKKFVGYYFGKNTQFNNPIIYNGNKELIGNDSYYLEVEYMSKETAKIISEIEETYEINIKNLKTDDDFAECVFLICNAYGHKGVDSQKHLRFIIKTIRETK